MTHFPDYSSDEQYDDEFSNRLTWGTTQLLLLGVIDRFKNNFDRYHYQYSQQHNSEIILQLTDKILYKQYALRNLLNATSEDAFQMHYKEASGVILVQQINNLIYQLHHEVLNLDTEWIETVIPDIDHQLYTWSTDRDHREMSYFLHNVDMDAMIRDTMQIRQEIRDLLTDPDG